MLNYLAGVANYLKEFLLIAFGLWGLSRELRLYLLRDIIAKKAEEIEISKVELRQVVADQLQAIASDVEALKLPTPARVIERDVEIAKSVADKINDASFHSSRDVATLGYALKSIVDSISYKGVQKSGVHGEEVDIILKDDFYKFIYKSLSLIDSTASRALIAPDKVSLYSPKFRGGHRRIFFYGSGIKYAKGLDQGPSINPGNPALERFFSDAIGLGLSGESLEISRKFFSIFRNNQFLALKMIDHGFMAPLEIALPRPHFFGDLVMVLTNFKISNTVSDSKPLPYKTVTLSYSNIHPWVSFVNPSSTSFLKEYFESLGFSEFQQHVIPHIETVNVTVLFSELRLLLLKLGYGTIWKFDVSLWKKLLISISLTLTLIRLCFLRSLDFFRN